VFGKKRRGQSRRFSSKLRGKGGGGGPTSKHLPLEEKNNVPRRLFLEKGGCLQVMRKERKGGKGKL